MKKSIFNDKKSDEYIYYSNDFRSHRFFEWTSVWQQAREVITSPDVKSVLEFGCGRNVNKALIEHFGIKHLGVDVNDTAFMPDVCDTISGFRTDEKFDLVCSFQVLEHNPFEEFEGYMKTLKSFSKKYVYVSLPYTGHWFSFQLHLNLPKIKIRKTFCMTKERVFKKTRPIEKFKQMENKYAPHWWEVGDKIASKKIVRKKINSCGLAIRKEFHNPGFPHHLFYLCEIVD